MSDPAYPYGANPASAQDPYLAGVSFLTVYLLLSIPAMVLSFMQRRKAKRLDAPQDIMALTNTAVVVTSICASLQLLVPLALLLAFFLSDR